MTFEAWWPWLLLPPLVVWVSWLTHRSYARLTPRAAWLSYATRLLLLLLLIGAVARPAWLRESTQRHTVFALDVSRSIDEDNLEHALEDVARLARAALDDGRDPRVSILAFGDRPRLLLQNLTAWQDWPPAVRDRLTHRATLPKLYRERTALISAGDAEQTALADVERRIAEVEAFVDEVVGEHTDLAAAMRLALSCGRPDQHHQLFLFTDGRFNRSDWQRTVARAGPRADLRVVALDRPTPPEVAATEVVLPAAVRVNEAFAARALLASTSAADARVRVFKNGYAVFEQDVKLSPGTTPVEIPRLYFREKGFHTVEVAVHSAADTLLENNRARAIVVVPGEARVLYVDADEDQMPYLKQALELEGIAVEARPATGVPRDIAELLSFDALILSNIPADRLSQPQMRMIRSYVEDYGGGFIMLGGDESFGLGGYFRTPLEEILPVRMPIQKDVLRPSLALALVIDKSGSMAGVKMQLAKRAALATADAIHPRDQIAVIGFDGAARVILDLTPAGDRATISGNIAALDAGGGTFLYPALDAAHHQLLESNARRKHVIILSDGQTQGYGYEDLAQIMSADGITLSTVGVGEDADMRLMDAIARAGGGRAHFTNDFYSIPQIFTREALRASKNMLVEGLIQPVALSHDVALQEIDVDQLPLLTGYVATTAKPAANTILVSDRGDPLLAKWRYGLGQTVAFTSDTKPRWAEDWIRWPDFAKFWAQLVRSVTGETLDQQLELTTRHQRDDRGVRFTADVRDRDGAFRSDLDLQLTAPSATDPDDATIPVRQVGPGLFEARLPTVRYGENQNFLWRFATPAAEPQTVPYGFVYSFSPEYRALGIDQAQLDDLQRVTGAPRFSVGAAEYRAAGAAHRRAVILWPTLLMLSLLLIPLDILIRRWG